MATRETQSDASRFERDRRGNRQNASTVPVVHPGVPGQGQLTLRSFDFFDIGRFYEEFVGHAYVEAHRIKSYASGLFTVAIGILDCGKLDSAEVDPSKVTHFVVHRALFPDGLVLDHHWKLRSRIEVHGCRSSIIEVHTKGLGESIPPRFAPAQVEKLYIGLSGGGSQKVVQIVSHTLKKLLDLLFFLVADHSLAGIVDPVGGFRVALDKLGVAFPKFGAFPVGVNNIIDEWRGIPGHTLIERRVLAMAFYIADLQVGLAASRGYRIANERRCFSRIILVRLLGDDRQGKNQNCGEQRASNQYRSA